MKTVFYKIIHDRPTILCKYSSKYKFLTLIFPPSIDIRSSFYFHFSFQTCQQVKETGTKRSRIRGGKHIWLGINKISRTQRKVLKRKKERKEERERERWYSILKEMGRRLKHTDLHSDKVPTKFSYFPLIRDLNTVLWYCASSPHQETLKANQITTFCGSDEFTNLHLDAKKHF